METSEISSNKARKNKKSHFFGYFRLLVGYTYRRTPSVNLFLMSFRGVNQLYMTSSGPRDMENHAVSSLQGPIKQKIIFLGHFLLSEGYTYLRIPTVK